VGIFRRASKDTNAEQDERAQRTTAEPGWDLANPDPGQAGAPASAAPELDPPDQGAVKGPLDRAEVDGLEGRLDLGALWVAGVEGMELRLEVEQESQNVVGVTAVLGESAVQLQAFAAPRTEGIWSDIRAEIAASITSQGGTADLTTGPLGLELQARMPGQAPDGRTVVVRGDEAMAPRELLTLKLPDQGPAASDQNGAEGEPAMAPSSMADLHPFDRGPEITEIH